MTVNITNKPLELSSEDLQKHLTEYRACYPVVGQEKESLAEFVTRKIKALRECYSEPTLLLG